MTFSIVARDPATGALGVAISTAVPCVGVTCPYVKTRVGAIASQAQTNARLGVDGLRLLELGLSPESALSALLKEDAGAATRQVGAIDANGRVFVHSGSECVSWFGHRTGPDYTVQGNMLVGEDTVDAMARGFEGAEGPLAERLVLALEAGQRAGGDKRGRESAALLVRAPPSALWEGADVRVDLHSEPVAELRRIFDVVQGRARELRAEIERAREKGAGLHRRHGK